MKANELMIGDWYKWYADGYYYNYQVTKETFGNDEDTIANFEPIPLTPEILEKNGFEKLLDDDGIHYRFVLIEGHTKFALKYARSVFQWLNPIDFKYVHELQHALKLCGIEKEIEL